MKKLLVACFFVFAFVSALQAQYVMLSDSYFSNRLRNMFPACFNLNGELDTTCTDITTLRRLDIHAPIVNGSLVPMYNINGIQYFDSLRYLNCAGNALSSIFQLPPYLDTLICNSQYDPGFINGYRFGALPPLPPTLTYLDISHNGFDSLRHLNEGLRWLNCNGNSVHLSGGFDRPSMRYIDSLPSTLEYLDCSANALTALPRLPAGLQVLKAANNRFVVNIIPYSFNFPGIACLPVLPASLDTLRVTGNQPITCLPNLVPGLFVDIPLDACNLTNNPNGCISSSGGALPVQLNSFYVSKQQQSARINWATAQEINSAYFIVERSVNQQQWTELRRVNAAGNSSSTRLYFTTDDYPARGINYYRLKPVDLDGTFSYSETKFVWIGNNATVVVAPNPAHETATIYLPNNNSLIQIKLVDMNGRVVYRNQQTSETISLDLRKLSKGIYSVQLVGKEFIESLKLLVE
jgi:Leucine-rich repeat (LRR) protein